MTRVLISYTRFLEVRARRLDILAELTQPDAPRTTDVTTEMLVSELPGTAKVAACGVAEPGRDVLTERASS